MKRVDMDQKVHIFHWTRSAYFSLDQKCIFFAGPKVHIFRRIRSAYFSPDQKCTFFAGPEVHIFHWTKSAYFSPDQKCIFSRDQKCIFFAGPKVQIFHRDGGPARPTWYHGNRRFKAIHDRRVSGRNPLQRATPEGAGSAGMPSNLIGYLQLMGRLSRE
jgi:hypothetical protein